MPGCASEDKETSEAFRSNPSMAWETTILELRSKSFSLKLTMIKFSQFVGMDITISTTAKTDDEAYDLLKLFGFPLRGRPVKETIPEVA